MIEGEPKVEACLPAPATGVRWGDHRGLPVLRDRAAFFRPGYVNNIVQNWLPASTGSRPSCEAGAKVADVGCGVGFSTLLMAEAFPNSQLRRLRFS